MNQPKSCSTTARTPTCRSASSGWTILASRSRRSSSRTHWQRDILPLLLDFNTEVGSFSAKLSIASTDGCVQFPVRAKGLEASKIGVIVHDPTVVNLGHVPVGTLSEPVELIVIDQPMTGEAKVKIGGFGSTNPSFRIEPQTKLPAADACESAKVSIRLMAPDEPGIVRGQLSWTFEGPEAAAFSVIEMVGFVD